MKVAIVKDNLGNTNTEFASNGVNSVLYEVTLGESPELGEGFHYMGDFTFNVGIKGYEVTKDIYAVGNYEHIYIEKPIYQEYGALYVKMYRDAYLEQGKVFRLGYMENPVLSMEYEDVRSAIDKAVQKLVAK